MEPLHVSLAGDGVEDLPGHDILMATMLNGAAVMDAAGSLKVISNFAVGVNNIDLAAAKARKRQKRPMPALDGSSWNGRFHY